jgi:hypothetical protein
VLVFGDPLEPSFIVGLIFCVVHPQRIGCFNKVVAEILVIGFAHSGLFCLKLPD